MSMDKRWNELFTRLEAVEAELKELKEAVSGTAEKQPKAPAKK